MDNLNLISNFAEFKELKNIDKSTMIGVQIGRAHV